MKQLLAIAQALSDESRLRILMCLDGSTLCLCHLTQVLGLVPSTVSKHLHVLAEAGLVTTWQEGRWRYYKWPGEDAPVPVRRALEWCREALAGDPTVAEDAARRAVALHTCGAPCPQVARPRVLFLCTGNSCRSQMAEALLRKHAGDRFEVYSAGLDPRPIPPLVHKVMAEVGCDLSGQRPKSVLDFLGKEYFGYVISVCANAEARCPIFPGVAYHLYWPFEDPAEATGTEEQRLAKFREVRDQIQARILAWLTGKEDEGREQARGFFRHESEQSQSTKEKAT